MGAISFAKVTSPVAVVAVIGVIDVAGACARVPTVAATSAASRPNSPNARGRRSLDITTSSAAASRNVHLIHPRPAERPELFFRQSERSSGCSAILQDSASCLKDEEAA